MTTVHQCDVLIVGGGPVGITLALLLGLRGVSVIVAEKDADIYPLPRAAHLDHETIRTLQEAGVAEEVVRSSRQTHRYDFLNADGDVLMRFDGVDGIGPGGWPIANMIHQPSVERFLRERLAELPNATLQCCWEFKGFVTTPAGVEANIATPNGEATIRARYLVGADGARSPVRKMAGIDCEDLGFDEPWLVVDAIVHDAERLPQISMQICDPERPTTCAVMGEGRHRWEFMIKPGETAEEMLRDERIEQLLENWNVKGAISIERKAVYTFRARIAREWRKGPILLVGDAAHQTPPFAGQGMCSGLRDTANLAWKLATVINEGAPDSLLDSYQPEREPNLRATIGMATMMGRTVCITDPVAAAERDRQMLAARAAGQSPDGPPNYPPIDAGLILKGAPAAGCYFPQPCAEGNPALKLDDVLGRGAWLLSRSPVAASEGASAVALDDPVLAPFRAALEGWLNARSAEAVLVRPDRYVFGTGGADSLRREWDAVTGGPLVLAA